MKDDNYIKRALSALTDYAVHMYSVADVDLQIKQKNVRTQPLLIAELLLMWHT